MIDGKTQKLLESLKAKKVGVFCDDSNLYYAYKNYGWRIDFARLKSLLEQYCNIQVINYYIAVPRKSDADYKGVQRFIERISSAVTIKTKPVKYIPFKSALIRKGDVDVEIVLDVVRMIDDIDVVAIMSGDSDFLALKNYVVNDRKKKIIFLGYEENMAWELRQCWHLYVNRIKDIIELVIKNKPQV